MSNLRLAEGEYRFARIVWENEPLPSGRLVELSLKELGWKKSTTYTVLKKCADKGLIQRRDPGFLCQALVSRADAQRRETRGLIDRMYGGRADRLVASLLEGRALDKAEIARLRQLVEDLS